MLIPKLKYTNSMPHPEFISYAHYKNFAKACFSLSKWETWKKLKQEILHDKLDELGEILGEHDVDIEPWGHTELDSTAVCVRETFYLFLSFDWRTECIWLYISALGYPNIMVKNPIYASARELINKMVKYANILDPMLRKRFLHRGHTNIRRL